MADTSLNSATVIILWCMLKVYMFIIKMCFKRPATSELVI